MEIHNRIPKIGSARITNSMILDLLTMWRREHFANVIVGGISNPDLRGWIAPAAGGGVGTIGAGAGTICAVVVGG